MLFRQVIEICDAQVHVYDLLKHVSYLPNMCLFEHFCKL